jgi:hypothetical protein
MHRWRLFFCSLALIGFGLFFASDAFAQATRTWVSGVGDDANPCSRTAPCKTFAGAISKTAPGGIIDALDSGGFGAVTITKAITIEAVGTVAGVLVSGTNAIIVAAGVNDFVVLRGLSIDGIGTGLHGVKFQSGAKLVVEHCTIQNFTLNGIDFEPSGNAQLAVSNTTINNITGSAVFVQAAATKTANATFDGARLLQSGFGLQVVNGTATLKNSAITGAVTNGVRAFGTPARINVDNSVISDGALTGVFAQGAQSAVFLSRSVVNNNNTALSAVFGGTISTFGDNRIFGNVNAGSTPTPIAQQ